MIAVTKRVRVTSGPAIASLVTSCFLLLFAARSISPAATPTAEGRRFKITLRDGSILHGESDLPGFRLRSRAATVSVHFDKVAFAQFTDNKTQLVMVNEDRVKGLSDIDTIPFLTVFGRLEIPIETVHEMVRDADASPEAGNPRPDSGDWAIARKTETERFSVDLVDGSHLVGRLDTDATNSPSQSPLAFKTTYGTHSIERGLIREVRAIEISTDDLVVLRRMDDRDTLGDWPPGSGGSRVPCDLTDRFGTSNCAARLDWRHTLRVDNRPLDDFTLALWVRLNRRGDGSGREHHTIASLDYLDGYRTRRLRLCHAAEPNSIALMIGAAQNGFTNCTLVAGQWYHIAVVCQGNTVSVYVNGDLRSAKVVPVPTISAVGGIGLGGTRYPREMNTGAIDDVCLYARALGSAEVRTLFESVTDARSYLGAGHIPDKQGRDHCRLEDARLPREKMPLYKGYPLKDYPPPSNTVARSRSWDRFSGQLSGTDREGRLLMSSDAWPDGIAMNTRELAFVHCPGTERSSGPHQFGFVGGDRVNGKLRLLTDREVHMDIDVAGPKKVQLSLMQAVVMSRADTIDSLDIPRNGSLKPWHSKGWWSAYNNMVIASHSGGGPLMTALVQENGATVATRILRGGTTGLSMALCADREHKNAIELLANGKRYTLRLITNGEKKDIVSVAGPRMLGEKLRFAYEGKSGNALFWIGGRLLICEKLTDTTRPTEGEFVNISTPYSTNLDYVKAYQGVVAPERPMLHGESESHLVYFVNGDRLTAGDVAYSEGVWDIRSEFASFEAPWEHVGGVYLAHDGREHAQTQDEVHVVMNGSEIHLKMDGLRIAKGALSGRSSVLGDVTIPVNRIREIRFHGERGSPY